MPGPGTGVAPPEEPPDEPPLLVDDVLPPVELVTPLLVPPDEVLLQPPEVLLVELEPPDDVLVDVVAQEPAWPQLQ